MYYVPLSKLRRSVPKFLAVLHESFSRKKFWCDFSDGYLLSSIGCPVLGSCDVTRYFVQMWETWNSEVVLNTCGPVSSVGIATGYGLDGLGIESRWSRDFPHLSIPALGLYYSLRSGHSSILPALNLQPAATREPDGLCGNQTLSSWAPDDGHNGARNMLSVT